MQVSQAVGDFTDELRTRVESHIRTDTMEHASFVRPAIRTQRENTQ